MSEAEWLAKGITIALILVGWWLIARRHDREHQERMAEIDAKAAERMRWWDQRAAEREAERVRERAAHEVAFAAMLEGIPSAPFPDEDEADADPAPVPSESAG